MVYKILSNIISCYPLKSLFKLFSYNAYLDFSQRQTKSSQYPQIRPLHELRKAKLCDLHGFPLFVLSSPSLYFWVLNNDKCQHFSFRNFLSKIMMACSSYFMLHSNKMPDISHSSIAVFPIILISSQNLLWSTKMLLVL